jgi:hypothetical protein
MPGVSERQRAYRSRYPAPCALAWTSALAPIVRGACPHGPRVLPLPRTCLSLDNACALSPICDEAGRRERIHCSVADRAQTRLCTRRPGGEGTSRRVWCSPLRSALSYGHEVRTRDPLLPTPGVPRRKKTKNLLSGAVCLLTRGGLIRVRAATSLYRSATIRNCLFLIDKDWIACCTLIMLIPCKHWLCYAKLRCKPPQFAPF